MGFFIDSKKEESRQTRNSKDRSLPAIVSDSEIETVPHIRSLQWIVNSGRDIVDFWLSIILIAVGVFVLSSPVPMAEHVFTSSYDHGVVYGFYSWFVFVGLINLFRLFFPHKIRFFWVTLFKALLAFCFLLLFTGSISLEVFVFTETHVVYGVLSIVALISVYRAL